MTDLDRQKIIRFEMNEARWVHEEIIRPSLYRWVDRTIKDVVEHGKYGYLGRLFHFLVEYFYVSMILRVRIKRSMDRELLGGKGYRPGLSKTRLNSIRSIVFKGGVEVAQRAFPIGIIQ